MSRDRRRAAEIARRERPRGESVVALPDWQFLTPRSTADHRTRTLPATTLFTVPVPQLGVRVDLRVTADASVGFDAGYTGHLRNIRAGMSEAQATLLALYGTQPQRLAPLAPFARDVHGIADVDVAGSVGLNVTLGGQIAAAAHVAGLDVASLGTALTATGSGRAALRLGGRVNWTLDRGHFRFRFSQATQAAFNLHLALTASVIARLLGFEWRRDWQLARAQVDREWRAGADLSVGIDGAPDAPTHHLGIGRDDVDLLDLARRVFSAATNSDRIEQFAAPAGGGGGAPPGGPGGGGAAGAAPPTGRSQNQPIPMTWYKPPGLYPPSITIAGTRYFLTEPDWVAVPDGPGLDDVRGDAMTGPGGQPAIRIGVPVNARNFPQIGRVWPRVHVGGVRGGEKQEQFRRLLTRHGFGWGTQEADHVRDLQWAGRDEYDNLWPLERAHNNAANQILNQPVTYTNAAGAPMTVPLRNTPRGLYFQIVAYG